MTRKIILSVLIGLFFIVLGGVVKNVLASMKKEIPRVENVKATGVLVSVEELNPIEEGITITGYGNVEPQSILPLTAEVSGKLIEMNRDFLEGKKVKKGELLFSIDPKDYELAEKKARSSLDENKASLTIIKQEELNIKRTIAINKRNLELVEKEMARYRSLIQEKSVSYSDLDKKENEYQTSLAALTQNQNILDLIPGRIQQAEAKIESSRASLDQALLDSSRTKIYAPFHARVLRKNAELGEYLTKGKVLGEIYDLSTLEVKVPMSLQMLKWIVPEFASLLPGPGERGESSIVEKTCDVLVELPEGNIQWNATLSRLDGQMDLATRTISAIVHIHHSEYTPGNGGKAKTELLRGMFVRVVFKGFLLKNIYKVPRNLVSNEDTVNLFEPLQGEEGKLRVRPIEKIHIYKDFVYIHKGLNPREKLITTPIETVVPGMDVTISRSGKEKN